MLTVSRQQARDRWDTLPDDIREVLISEEASDFIMKTCEDEHILDDRVLIVSRFAGYVLFGFLHPDDLAKELRDALQIDVRITTVIAKAIDARLFAPVRSELDKIYRPLTTSAAISAPVAGPKMLEEVKQVVPVAARMSQPTPASFAPGPSVPPRPTPPPPLMSMSQVPSSQPGMPSTGWSKMPSAGDPSRTLDLRNSVLSPAQSVSFPNLQKTETGKIPLPPMGTDPVATKRPQTTDQGPMPVILESNMAAPLSQKPDFSIKSEDKIAALGSSIPRPDARPVVLEFGGQPMPTPPRPASAMPKPPSYSSVAPRDDRNVTELTSKDIPRP